MSHTQNNGSTPMSSTGRVHEADLDSDLENEADLDADSEMESNDKFAVSSEELAQMNEKDLQNTVGLLLDEEQDDMANLDEIDNILDLNEEQFPKFTLAKNKARFLRMVSWYRGKEEWIEVAPLSGVTKLFKQQTKELEGIRSSKMDYEMELETGTLTPSQRSYRRDELKMCKVQEKMAVHLISKLQLKIKSGRR